MFEKLTRRDIYDALESDLAKPIGMQDFNRERQRKSGDEGEPRLLEQHADGKTQVSNHAASPLNETSGLTLRRHGIKSGWHESDTVY